MSRAILVSGSSGGIGKAGVIALANAGFTVYAGVMNEHEVSGMQSLHPLIKPVILDVANEASILQTMEFICADLKGPLYGIWSNAGIAHTAPLRYASGKEIDDIVRVNLVGPLWLISRAVPFLQAGQSRVLITGSATGMLAGPCVSIYASTKWGLEGLADSLRLELGAVGIKVSLLEPGVVKTAMVAATRGQIEALHQRMSPDDQHAYTTLLAKLADFSDPTRNGVEPEKVAQAVIHAFSDGKPRSRYRIGSDSKAVAILRHLPDGLRDRLQRKLFGL